MKKFSARQCSRINPEQRIKREKNLIFEFKFATALDLLLILLFHIQQLQFNDVRGISMLILMRKHYRMSPHKFHSAAVNWLVTGVMSHKLQHFQSYWVPVNTAQLSLESKTHSSIQFNSNLFVVAKSSPRWEGSRSFYNFHIIYVSYNLQLFCLWLTRIIINLSNTWLIKVG